MCQYTAARAHRLGNSDGASAEYSARDHMDESGRSSATNGVGG